MLEQIRTRKKLRSINMKKLLTLLLSFTLAFPIQTVAECVKSVTLLENGASAPCRGFLFTPEKEQEVRLLSEDYTYLKQETELKDKKIELLVKDIKDTEFIIKRERDQTELWRKTAEDSTLKLTQKEDRQGRRDWIFLLMGVALTVGAGWAVGQASK